MITIELADLLHYSWKPNDKEQNQKAEKVEVIQ